MTRFGGLVSSRRYRVDQELEIYNFRVVPELQISSQVDFLRFICVYFFVRKQGGSAKPDISDLAELLLNLSPVRRRCNDIRYPRGF